MEPPGACTRAPAWTAPGPWGFTVCVAACPLGLDASRMARTCLCPPPCPTPCAPQAGLTKKQRTEAAAADSTGAAVPAPGAAAAGSGAATAATAAADVDMAEATGAPAAAPAAEGGGDGDGGDAGALTGRYELAAVLTHKGRSADSGHYVSWVKQVGVGPGRGRGSCHLGDERRGAWTAAGLAHLCTPPSPPPLRAGGRPVDPV